MKLIRGAPGSGKTALVFREFKDALRAGAPNLRIVVPTATLVRHFQHELARDGIVFSPRSVVSLNRFIRERAAALPNEPKQIPDGLLRVLVRDSLDRMKFPEFASVAGTEGMAATVVDTIELFENAGCTPDKLASVRKLGPHAKPFEKLWRTVRDAVRQCGYHLRGDLIRATAANTQPARIWLDGFLNFSPIEYAFLRELSKTCNVTLAITDSKATEEIYRFAVSLGAKDRLLPGKSRKPRTILVEARTLEREADEIARRIIALEEQGTAFRRLAVAVREAATWVPLLKGTFSRFGIPARFYFSSPLGKQPAAVFLGGLISAVLAGWDFETTLTTLRAHPRWGTSAAFDRFDFAVREAMPGRGVADLLALCEDGWLREDIAACLKIDAWKTSLLKPAEWLKRFDALATNLYRPGTLDTARDAVSLQSARSHVAAVRSWLDAVSSITALPEQPVSLENFWRAASIAVDAAVIHPVDDRANVVHVMSVYEARQWDVAALFVCGMTDRDFPRQHSPNLLFPENDIDRLRTAGVPLRKAADYEQDERWLFESLCTRASDSLVLSYPRHDASGKSVQRSRLVDFDRQAESAPLCRPVPQALTGEPVRAGSVDTPALHAEMARLHQSISLTALEDLAQCRFRFFSGRTLALKAAPERPGERLTPRVTGSILHVALERWLADKTRDFVEVFEAVFDETCRTDHLPAGYKLEVERIQFREIARRVSANDLWTPDSSQVEVPLEIEFPGPIASQPIRVRCRIDRLDTFSNATFSNATFGNKDCVIVDYKSSKTANVQKLVASRTRLQGPLYALAVRENLHLNPVAMLYWAVRDDQRYGWGKIPGADVPLEPMPDNWANDAKARTIERLSGFLAGAVHAHPEETEQCRWCEFGDTCRVETLVEIERAAGGGSSAG
jgi:ATP-dependent helicase/DNAse subunit B